METEGTNVAVCEIADILDDDSNSNGGVLSTAVLGSNISSIKKIKLEEQSSIDKPPESVESKDGIYASEKSFVGVKAKAGISDEDVT